MTSQKPGNKAATAAIFKVLRVVLIVFTCLQSGVLAFSQSIDSMRILHAVKGMYFKSHTGPDTLSRSWEEIRQLLPRPVYAENPVWVDMYYKAWNLAFKNLQAPAAGSGFVSKFVDASFNENIFLWDGCFISMFCNYGSPFIPGISSMNNFYCKQYPDGEICREINRNSGNDFADWDNWENLPLFTRWHIDDLPDFSRPGKRTIEPAIYIGRAVPAARPYLTLDVLDHPIVAWAELESYRVSGDRSRLNQVYLPLKMYFESLKTFLEQGNGLFMTDWASMDNAVRNPLIRNGGTAIDISSEMAQFAYDLAIIARINHNIKDASFYQAEHERIAKAVNTKMWDSNTGFYHDLKADESKIGIKTIAGFWPLIAHIPSKTQASRLRDELNNRQSFNRVHRVPTMAANEPGFDPLGGYWRGSVWAPTNMMVIRGLQEYGYEESATQIAMNDLQNMATVFQNTGTVWENYAADRTTQGNASKKDFVGWSGLGPILFFLEFAVGLRPDAGHNHLDWNIHSDKLLGCERYRFAGHAITLLSGPARQGKKLPISVESDGPFTLTVIHGAVTRKVNIHKGITKFCM